MTTPGDPVRESEGPDEQPPAPQVWPTLRAKDAVALMAFLMDALGFELTVAYEDGDRIAHAELAWPAGGGVMLGSIPAEDADDDWAHRARGFAAYAVTPDPDGLFARATAAGAEILRPLHDTDYGSRDFAVKDPEGNTWSFGTYAGHPRQTSPPAVPSTGQ